MLKTNRARGFSLVELLIVLAILGILSAIALANYWNSLNRTRQKRTMADLRTIAIAWEARATDFGSYSAAGFTFPTNAYTPAEMSVLLSPTYLRAFPVRDAWHHALDFGANQTLGSSVASTLYAVRSRGRDNAFDTGGAYPVGPTTRFDCDIIFSNGNFVVYPEGLIEEK
jgi:prepilin-type N-terminal cleavage/methylation domain-containing protein